MANLSKLLAKSKESALAKQTETATPATEVEAIQAPAGDDQPTQEAPAEAKRSLGFLGRKAEAVPATTQQVESAKPKLAGLSLSKRVSAEPEASGADAAAVDDAPSESSIESLSDLENLDVSAPVGSSYPDEIPATEIVRPIPEDANEQMLSFVKLLDSVHTIGHDPKLLADVIRSIMIELQTNPAYISSDWKKSLVQPDDIRLWIRNMRESMGLAKVAKAEAKAKRGGKKKEVERSEMLDDLASLGFVAES